MLMTWFWCSWPQPRLYSLPGTTTQKLCQNRVSNQEIEVKKGSTKDDASTVKLANNVHIFLPKNLYHDITYKLTD